MLPRTAGSHGHLTAADGVASGHSSTSSQQRPLEGIFQFTINETTNSSREHDETVSTASVNHRQDMADEGLWDSLAGVPYDRSLVSAIHTELEETAPPRSVLGLTAAPGPSTVLQKDHGPEQRLAMAMLGSREAPFRPLVYQAGLKSPTVYRSGKLMISASNVEKSRRVKGQFA